MLCKLPAISYNDSTLSKGSGMDHNEVEDKRVAFDRAVQPAPGGYNFLLRISRKLGGVATKSSLIQDIRGFMSQPITYDAPARWLGSSVAMLKGDEASPVVTSPKTAVRAATPAKAKEKELKKIVEQSHEVLMAANTVFPITLFPDTVTVDRTKVTIIRRDFFWSSDVMSIRIEDVLNVSASVGPLFGSLTVASRVMSTIDHFQINHFWRNDAIRLKHIIQGYVIAQHNNIDTAHLSRKELIDTIVELGDDSNK